MYGFNAYTTQTNPEMKRLRKAVNFIEQKRKEKEVRKSMKIVVRKNLAQVIAENTTKAG